MKENKEVLALQLHEVITAASDWLSSVLALGNQCAATDRKLEAVIDKAEKLKEEYESNFEGYVYHSLCEKYWKQYIKDYISCGDDEFTSITDEDIDDVIEKLTNEDRFWTEIDYILDHKLIMKAREKDGKEDSNN